MGSPATILSMAIGALIAFSHLLLDSVTQAGVYSLRNRVALAHFSYDNPFLNIGFALIGIGLAVVSFLGWPPRSLYVITIDELTILSRIIP